MFLQQIGRYIASSRFSRRGVVFSWVPEIVDGSQQKRDGQEFPVWFCPAAASGLQPVGDMYKMELKDTLFLTDKTWAVICRFEKPLWDLLNDRGRVKEFNFDGANYFISEFSDYLSARTYIGLQLKRSEVGTGSPAELLTQAGGFLSAEDGSNFITE